MNARRLQFVYFLVLSAAVQYVTSLEEELADSIFGELPVWTSSLLSHTPTYFCAKTGVFELVYPWSYSRWKSLLWRNCVQLISNNCQWWCGLTLTYLWDTMYHVFMTKHVFVRYGEYPTSTNCYGLWEMFCCSPLERMRAAKCGKSAGCQMISTWFELSKCNYDPLCSQYGS